MNNKNHYTGLGCKPVDYASLKKTLKLKIKEPDFLIDLQSVITESVNYFYKQSERDIEIFKRRYGLDGRKPCNLQEIGIDYQLTRERIRQIVNVVLSKMKRHYKKESNRE